MDIFQTVGAVLAMVLILMQIFDRFSTFRRSCLNFAHCLGDWWNRFSDWRYWRSHYPTLHIVNSGVLRIRKADNMYFLEASITMDIHNRDKRYPLNRDGIAFLDVYHRKWGREKGPYRLFCKSGRTIEKLEQDEKKRLSLEFRLGVPETPRPLLGEKAKAQLTLEGIKIRSLGARVTKTDKFMIPIEWFDS